MSHICKDLQVEWLLSLGQYLHRPGTLFRHEELVGIWQGEKNGRFKLLATETRSWVC